VRTVPLSAERPVVERGLTADADCRISGPAEPVHLAPRNRAPFPEVSGDPAPAGPWRTASAIA
jgi:hypothetical protein